MSKRTDRERPRKPPRYVRLDDLPWIYSDNAARGMTRMGFRPFMCGQDDDVSSTGSSPVASGPPSVTQREAAF